MLRFLWQIPVAFALVVCGVAGIYVVLLVVEALFRGVG